MFITKRSIICVLLSVCLVLSFAGLAFAQFSDTTGHWAESQINDWTNKGFIKGYENGQFKPNGEITRAEFITLVNKSFGYSASSAISFSDVKSTDWFAGEIGKAAAAGYISGYSDGTMGPNKKISRQEAAVIVNNILKLSNGDVSAVDKFTDAGQIPDWSKKAVSAVVTKGFMSGYPDKTFQPTKSITRAEAVSTLDRSVKSTVETVVYDQAGTYGPATGTETIKGNVTVSVRDVTLQNLVINGDLLLAEGIGDGDVTLKNVTVKGETVIKGGGANSVTLENCTLSAIRVSKEGVRVVATGTTRVNIVTLESGATLVEVTITGEGFEEVTVSEVVPAGAQITLDGNFSEVTVGAKAEIKVEKGKVENLTLNAAAKVTGEGTIAKATINTSGASIAQTPTTSQTLAPGVSANVGGSNVSNNTSQPATTPTGGSGGGGGGTSTVSVSSIAVNYGDNSNLTDTSAPYTYGFDAVANDKLIKSIQVNSSILTAKVNITQVKVGSTNFIASGQEKLNLSANAPITMETLIGNGLGVGGVSLGNLRQLIGENKDIVITGYVSAPSYNNLNVSVTLNTGSGAGGGATNEYVTVARNGLNITATIKAGQETKTMTDIDLLDVLNVWQHSVVEYKKGALAAVTLNPAKTGKTDIKGAIESWVGVAAGQFDNIMLQDMKNATSGGGYLKVKNKDNLNEYKIFVN